VACGGSDSPGAVGCGSPGNSALASAVAYSACMRSHGVPNYPDPGSDGNLPKGNAQAFGVSNSQYQAAERACRHLLPNSDTGFCHFVGSSESVTRCGYRMLQAWQGRAHLLANRDELGDRVYVGTRDGHVIGLGAGGASSRLAPQLPMARSRHTDAVTGPDRD
jgi:hypothetical protein